MVMPQPTRASVAEQARQAAVSNTARLPQNQDRTYNNEWQNFCIWVNRMRHENIIPLGNVYLTRENVDLYFSTVVVERKVQPTTARRVVSALQKFADTQEYIDGTESFTVDSLAVMWALTTQAELW